MLIKEHHREGRRTPFRPQRGKGMTRHIVAIRSRAQIDQLEAMARCINLAKLSCTMDRRLCELRSGGLPWLDVESALLAELQSGRRELDLTG
jgi:hypothetical protein